MATIRERKDYGSWQAIIERKGYKRQSKTFKSYKAAVEWARDIESEIDKGTFVSREEAERTTLFEALGRYEREILPGKKGAAKEKSVIRIMRDDALAKRSLASIRGSDIASHRDELLKIYAPATVVRRLAMLSHVFNTARREWRMESLSNPVEAVSKPKLPRGRDRRVAVVGAHGDELERIIAATESVELPLFVRLSVETAMRRGEMAGLTWSHVDLKKHAPFGLVRLVDTKNDEARTVPLSSKAAALLEAASKDSNGKDKEGRVFSMTPDAITRAFARAVVRARKDYEAECKKKKEKPVEGFLVGLRLHDLRHEAASQLFEKGLDVMEVASITGHKTLQMLKRYTHLRAEDLARKLG